MKILAPLLLSAFAMPTLAAPKYYAFYGRVGMISADVGGYAAAHHIQVGDPAAYLFIVDTEKQGYSRQDGSTTPKSDIVDDGSGYSADYFFDSLVTPSLFSAAVTDSTSGSYFGYHTLTRLGAATRNSRSISTTIGSVDWNTSIAIGWIDTTANGFLPLVGDKFFATESYIGPSGAFSGASIELTLVSITDSRPAPLIDKPKHRAQSKQNRSAHLFSMDGKRPFPFQPKFFNASGRERP